MLDSDLQNLWLQFLPTQIYLRILLFQWEYWWKDNSYENRVNIGATCCAEIEKCPSFSFPVAQPFLRWNLCLRKIVIFPEASDVAFSSEDGKSLPSVARRVKIQFRVTRLRNFSDSSYMFYDVGNFSTRKRVLCRLPFNYIVNTWLPNRYICRYNWRKRMFKNVCNGWLQKWTSLSIY